MPRTEPAPEARNLVDPDFRDALFAIEPELRRLAAVMTNLTILSTAQDNIESVALTVLAEVGAESVEQISNKWRTLLDHSQGLPFRSGLTE